MSTDNTFKLSDEAIGQIAKLVQMAMISGTDIVDHLRLMRLCESDIADSTLVLTEEYRDISTSHIEKMLTELEDIKEYQS